MSFDNVVFNDLYNQFSSVFGTISFEKCTFNNFTPVLYEYSYNTYNEHNLVFNNCTFNPSIRRNYLVFAGKLSDARNERNELYKKCWPKLSIKNMIINVPKGLREVIIMNSTKEGNKMANIDEVQQLTIRGMSFTYTKGENPVDLVISNNDIFTDVFDLRIRKLNLIPCKDSNQDIDYGRMIINIKGTKEKISIRNSRIAKIQ